MDKDMKLIMENWRDLALTEALENEPPGSEASLGRVGTVAAEKRFKISLHRAIKALNAAARAYEAANPDSDLENPYDTDGGIGQAIDYLKKRFDIK